jgi:hypothetical protein
MTIDENLVIAGLIRNERGIEGYIDYAFSSFGLYKVITLSTHSEIQN